MKAPKCVEKEHILFLFSFACFFIIYSIIWNTCYIHVSIYIHIYHYSYISIYSSTICDRPFSRWWQEGWWWKLTLLWAIIGRPWQSLPRIWRTPFGGMGPDGCGIKTREGDGYFELKVCFKLAELTKSSSFYGKLWKNILSGLQALHHYPGIFAKPPGLA